MSVSVRGLRAEAIAHGLVASCRVLDLPVTAALSADAAVSLRPRTLTARALLSAWPRRGPRDGAVNAVAALLNLRATALAPTGNAERFDVEQLLTVVEAMKAAGFDPAAVSAVRSHRERGAPGAAKPTSQPRETRSVATPSPADRPKSASAEPKPRPAPVPAANPAPMKAAAPAAAPVRSMNANVRRWTRQFLRAGWTPREVARLFDLHIAQVKAVKVEGLA